jgi:hypothetical protein
MHMTLYSIALPEQTGTTDAGGHAELVGRMQQLLQGLRVIGSKQSLNHIAFEVAVANDTQDIVFYVAVPDEYRELFEKQTLSLFPHAVLALEPHDYNVFGGDGAVAGATVSLKKHMLYPLATAADLATDPLEVLLNACSDVTMGEGVAVQFLVRYPTATYRRDIEQIKKQIEKGAKVGEAISRSTLGGAVLAEVGSLFTSKKPSTDTEPKDIDTATIEQINTKLQSDIIEVQIRVVASAHNIGRSEDILTELLASLAQFENVAGNTLVTKRVPHKSLRQFEKAFSFRQFDKSAAMPLNLTELASLVHFPGNGVAAAHQFRQSSAQTAPAPTELPTKGTLLGRNVHRAVERDVRITDEDRLRHFYIIGQTGTGKTTLMKNMIVQDIQRGDGACLIDPHGTDIEDVLGAVPPERADDVIYFDPSRMDRVLGLNMLEFDETKPEQKTFVVNELFSIFQKLYGANPESMGPMFEQYFRNATMLVMEDPASGNTLMDIGRVMADAQYRRYKLSKATNPVVVQFWREIAGKAGGEASLENIVPYIVSKFDVFTANDYMRPIIGQQQSAFNFRQIMDERKILLVNLSKGRLGEINANLIGMILVGKILMAALSRVDDSSKGYPPFYLHMDEFQNISTNSISAILSEARKYKLGLTMAHQFIAQLQPDIKDAVFGNVGSMAAFRVGPEDSQFLESQFNPPFTASDLMNVPNRNAFLRVLANGTPTKPFSISTMRPVEPDLTRTAELIERSLDRYGQPRSVIEADISARYQKPKLNGAPTPAPGLPGNNPPQPTAPTVRV